MGHLYPPVVGIFRRSVSGGAFALLLAASSCLFESCIFEYGDNCPDRLPLRIENDWRAYPDASPEGMAYIFFPTDGSVAWRFDFPGREGGEVMLPPGRYSFISHNDDNTTLLFADDGGYSGYEAFTGSAELLRGIPVGERGRSLPVMKGAEESVVRCPEKLVGCAYGSVGLDYDGLDYITSSFPSSGDSTCFSSDFLLTAYQRPLTAHYSFRIEDVSNLEGVSSLSAALSGMAGSLFIASGEKGRYPSVLSLTASKKGASVIGGEFYTFGIPARPDRPNVLSLCVVIKDGRRFCYEFDVTDQVRGAADPMEVEIVVSGLSIEVPNTGGGEGFDVSVDGWDTVEVNING